MIKKTDVLILGAGITGLAAAKYLSENGKSVIVVEKSPFIGGLARTVKRGDNSFDLGGHRLYFSDHKLEQDVENLLGPENLIKQKRKSRIVLGGRFLNYPPTLAEAVFHLSPEVIFSAIRSPAAGFTGGASLKDWLIGNFGGKIHDIYFRDYTKKVWGLETSEISAAWAEARIGKTSMIKMAADLLPGRARAKENAKIFSYPLKGIGELPKAFARALEGKAEIITSACPIKFIKRGAKLAALEYDHDNTSCTVEFNDAISTIPLCDCGELLGLEKDPGFRNLRYRALIIAFVLIEKPAAFDDHWLYFPDKDIFFSRGCELCNWSPYFKKDALYPMTFEIFCDKGDETWTAQENDIKERLLSSFKKIKGLEKAAIKYFTMEKLDNAYPLLYSGYEKDLAAATAGPAAYGNLKLAGRSGTHSYFDLEECLKSAKAAAEAVIK